MLIAVFFVGSTLLIEHKKINRVFGNQIVDISRSRAKLFCVTLWWSRLNGLADRGLILGEQLIEFFLTAKKTLLQWVNMGCGPG